MTDKRKKMPNFTKEKTAILNKTIGQFDGGTKVRSPSPEEKVDTTSIKDRTFLLHVLIETLCYILEKDEYKRKELFKSLYKTFEENKVVDSVIDVDNLAQMRRHVARRFYDHIKEVHQSIGPLSNEPVYEESESHIPISRIEKYQEAFDQLEIIAQGGFGKVYKARHKVDGGIYAVKQIIFVYRNDSDYIKVMREVRNLSGLSNKYVVSYNNAWVQPVIESCDSNELYSESDYTDYMTKSNSVHDDQSASYSNATAETYLYKTHGVASSCASSSIIFQDGSQSNLNLGPSESSSSIVFKDSQVNLNTSRNKLFPSSHLESEGSASNLPTFPFKIKMMLCIQMEFCDYDLRHWLDARNKGDKLPFSKSVQDIFKEILCGVAYIHEKDIIHRDLKPQNIFFSCKKGVMKVGDFGLATLSHSPSDEGQLSSNHSTNLGTLPYAAPEQRSKPKYDFKVDMYSLGIILIELLVKIETMMQFSEIIQEIKGNEVPEEINQNWPEYVPLLKNLLKDDHDERMEAKQVLDLPLFKDVMIEGNNLEQKVKDLERELAHKEQEFQEREKMLFQKLQQQEQVMEQRLEEQKRELELKFQEQKRKMEEALNKKELIFQQISEEVMLLKEQLNI